MTKERTKPIAWIGAHASAIDSTLHLFYTFISNLQDSKPYLPFRIIIIISFKHSMKKFH